MTTVERDWGSYTIIADGAQWTTKILRIKKDKSISLQRHFWRTEHWLFLEGRGLFWKEHMPKALEQKSGMAVWIVKNQLHWVKNISPHTQDLVILETWMGTKLDEKDIERIADETIIPIE
jgi:mannose-6-phosphate isomerase-like protein (cupin superfamily)